jgi:glycosyltransferase involved in cell wall biosynthesis
MSDPLVSVVTPCYNHARFLPEAVASVAVQTLDRWEIVIVDDGSSDDTVAVARTLIDRYGGWRIRLISHSNCGQGASRNVGIAAGSAPYVLPLDADDIVMPRMLERTVAALEADARVGFVTTNARFFESERNSWSGGDPRRERLLYDCRMIPAGTLFRRSAWQQAGGFHEQPDLLGYEDWDFWLRLVELGWKGRLLPEVLVWYRRSASGTLNRVQRNDLIFRARLVQYHPSLYPRPFQAWAQATLREQGRDALAGLLWWRWFFWYAALVARYAPNELPKTLLRPLFKRLDPQQQMYARRVAQLVGLSRAG